MTNELDNTSKKQSTSVMSTVGVENPLIASGSSTFDIIDLCGQNIDEKDGQKWYVIQVYSGFENKVADSIREEILRKKLQKKFSMVVVPTEEVIEMRRGSKTKVEKKLLPSYILVRMELNDQTWHLIINTQRVISFLGSGKTPSPISSREARRILRITQGIDQSGQIMAPRLAVSYSVGEQVRVSDGPFMSFNGVVEDVDEDRGRLKVSVVIFGRSTPVELDYTQVDKL